MHLGLIAGGIAVTITVIWLLIRTTSNNSLETTKTVLSSDNYTRILLAIIALSTTTIALQGFLN